MTYTSVLDRRRRVRRVGGLGALHRVATELVPHRGDRLHRRRVVLPRREPGEQRRRRWPAPVRRGRSRPRRSNGPRRSRRRTRGSCPGGCLPSSAFTIRSSSQDRITVPSRQDSNASGTFSTMSGGLEQLEALGVRLHDRVLDAVVDHLGEVPGADLAGVHETELALGLERLKIGISGGDRVGLVAAAHQRVAVLQTPDAAGDAAVDEPDALLRRAVRRDGCRRSSGCCRRRSRCRPRRAARPARSTTGSIACTGTITQTTFGWSRRGQLADHVGQVLGVGDVLVVVEPDHGHGPRSRIRSRMLPPILPRPTRPSSIVNPLVLLASWFSCSGGPASARSGTR